MPTIVTAEILNSRTARYRGGAAVGAADEVLIETGDVSMYNTFMLMSSAGLMKATVSLDGTLYATDPVNLSDQGALNTTPVIQTAAGRIFAFRGVFGRIKILTADANQVSDACLMCGVL